MAPGPVPDALADALHSLFPIARERVHPEWEGRLEDLRFVVVASRLSTLNGAPARGPPPKTARPVG